MGRRSTSPTYAKDTATSATLPGVSTWRTSRPSLAATFSAPAQAARAARGARKRTSLPPGRLALFRPPLGPPALTTSSGPRACPSRAPRCPPGAHTAVQLCQSDESADLAALPENPQDLVLLRNSAPAWELHAVVQRARACPAAKHGAAAVTIGKQASAFALVSVARHGSGRPV